MSMYDKYDGPIKSDDEFTPLCSWCEQEPAKHKCVMCNRALGDICTHWKPARRRSESDEAYPLCFTCLNDIQRGAYGP